MDETSMIERVALAIFEAMDVTDGLDTSSAGRYAKAAVEAMRNADNDMLEAMHNAMFTSKFTGRELPMLGAGFEAAIDTALSPAIGNKESGDE